MAMGMAEFEVSRYARTFSVVSSGSTVMPTVLIRVRRPFVRRWAAEQRDGGYTMFLGVDEVIYVGMEEVLERTGGSSHHSDTSNLPFEYHQLGL